MINVQNMLSFDTEIPLSNKRTDFPFALGNIFFLSRSKHAADGDSTHARRAVIG